MDIINSKYISAGDVIIVYVGEDEDKTKNTVRIAPGNTSNMWVMLVEDVFVCDNKKMNIMGELFTNTDQNMKKRMYLEGNYGGVSIDDDSLICVFMWLGDELTDHLELADDVLKDIEKIVSF